MALLGLIHRTVLGRGPRHFKAFFAANHKARAGSRRRHALQLLEFSEGHWTDYAYPHSRPADYIAHSILGLVALYNRLPARIVEASGSVSEFQGALQELLISNANAGMPDWQLTYSTRIPWLGHPLLRVQS
eukprot:3851646-Karenia_brevis.AAC.1